VDSMFSMKCQFASEVSRDWENNDDHYADHGCASQPGVEIDGHGLIHIKEPGLIPAKT
jgi:hypothetical protein